MNPYKNHTLDELLLMSLNDEVLDRILEVLEQKQRTVLERRRETTHSISARAHKTTTLAANRVPLVGQIRRSINAKRRNGIKPFPSRFQ